MTWSSREKRFACYIVWKEALSLPGCDHWRVFSNTGNVAAGEEVRRGG